MYFSWKIDISILIYMFNARVVNTTGYLVNFRTHDILHIKNQAI